MQPHVSEQPPKHAVTSATGSTSLKQVAARGFQQLPVFDSSRAHLFAGAAAETTINVPFKCRRLDRQTSFANRAHQVQPAAWSVILVAGDYVGGTRFKTQPAVNTSQQLLFFGREGGCKLIGQDVTRTQLSQVGLFAEGCS